MLSIENSANTRIYLDHNATTSPSKVVLEQLPRMISEWGNPSSIHLSSRGPKNILRETRKLFAEIFNCSPLEVIFNSGASEGNNTVLKSVWNQFGLKKNEYIISNVEHPCVLKTAEYLKSLGAVIHLIPVSKSGVLDIEFIKNHINEKTALVSCMFANNETGTLFPLKQISEITQKNNILFHADCVQALGKSSIDLKDLHLDYATFSGHKFYALKGSGVLFVKKNAPYTNLIHGGGQERSRRGGTENVLGIASLQVMLSELKKIDTKIHEMKTLRDAMESEILKLISDVKITAVESERLPNTSSLVISGVDGETLLMSLDIIGFSVSTGAACSSGSPEPSPVLIAMGLTKSEAQNSLRIGLGWSTTKLEVDQFILSLKDVVLRIRNANMKETIHG
jgi:cysteine desulfurase